MALSVPGWRVNVTKHFSDGGTQTTEVLVLSETSGAAEQAVRNSMTFSNVLVATSLESRRITSIDFTYVGPA
jgi:hypothetical protein